MPVDTLKLVERLKRVDTAKFFERLLPHVAPGIVCDVGSMNGADAARCARAVPGARVFAFEPNPHNLAPMLADAMLRDLGVEVIGKAVSEEEMVAPFHVLRADYSTVNYQRGRSSMYPAVVAAEHLEVVEVPVVRLDAFLASRMDADARLAFWVDAEGMAYEVLAGASGVRGNLHLVHVEVERVPCMNPSQKLYADVKRLLESWGLEEIATDGLAHFTQFNAVYVRAGLGRGLALRIAIFKVWGMLSTIYFGAGRRLRRLFGH
ncbi:MAG TPA: FkbM family methyltransferase [Steroidobacteraceae bacterium]|jgi:FkbM family methyltransferase|nr:FkbM family methyltransferase [Steroidobacteraceae bacterium]